MKNEEGRKRRIGPAFNLQNSSVILVRARANGQSPAGRAGLLDLTMDGNRVELDREELVGSVYKPCGVLQRGGPAQGLGRNP